MDSWSAVASQLVLVQLFFQKFAFKLRKLVEFRFKNLVQFGIEFSCHEAPEKSDASEIYGHATVDDHISTTVNPGQQ
jgi:hypothetical protein